MIRKGIPQKEKDLLFLQSGNLCAFPACTRQLVQLGTGSDDPTVVGEISHIEAYSNEGPRANKDLTDKERNSHINLVLLCGDHHKVVDSQPNTYSLPVLRQMKTDHEARIRAAFQQANATLPQISPFKNETIQSSLLPLTYLPSRVYSAPCDYRDGQEGSVAERLRYPSQYELLLPFVLRDQRLFTFYNLRDDESPFADVVARGGSEFSTAIEMCRQSDGKHLYVRLLNKALRKYLLRLGLQFDREHGRYFFPIQELGQERSVTYRSMNRKSIARSVVWQPKRKSTGEARDYWYHLAVGLDFLQMDATQWCLSIRPERHLTIDGDTPVDPQKIGSRVTRSKARMYNNKYLNEVNFWREFLSQGKPRIILSFGNQSAILATQLLTVPVYWPGVPNDDGKFANQSYEDDLFSLLDLEAATSGAEEWDDLAEGDDIDGYED